MKCRALHMTNIPFYVPLLEQVRCDNCGFLAPLATPRLAADAYLWDAKGSPLRFVDWRWREYALLTRDRLLNRRPRVQHIVEHVMDYHDTIPVPEVLIDLVIGTDEGWRLDLDNLWKGI